MESTALSIQNISKRYSKFYLDHVSFQVPSGSIVGLIGENGAGKSTTIQAILDLISIEDGNITFFGQSDASHVDKNELGVVLDGDAFPDMLNLHQLEKVFQKIYTHWDSIRYRELLEMFRLPVHKKIKELSKGMKMKYALAVALSHHPKLLILDEATSGLDPIMRDDILDLFLDFIQEEDHSILVSSHITSDLEKVADYIVFLHEGKVLFAKPKDELLEWYGILKCGNDEWNQIDSSDILRYRKLDYEVQALVEDRQVVQKKYPEQLVIPASIEEIMLLVVKGETL